MEEEKNARSEIKKRILFLCCVNGEIATDAFNVFDDYQMMMNAVYDMSRKKWISVRNGIVKPIRIRNRFCEWKKYLPEDMREKEDDIIKNVHSVTTGNEALHYRLKMQSYVLCLTLAVGSKIYAGDVEKAGEVLKEGTVYIPAKWIKQNPKDGFDYKAVMRCRAMGSFFTGKEALVAYSINDNNVRWTVSAESTYLMKTRYLCGKYNIPQKPHDRAILFMKSLDNIYELVPKGGMRKTYRREKDDARFIQYKNVYEDMLIVPSTYEGSVILNLLFMENYELLIDLAMFGTTRKPEGIFADYEEKNESGKDTLVLNMLKPSLSSLERFLSVEKVMGKSRHYKIICFKSYEQGIRNIFPDDTQVVAMQIEDVLTELGKAVKRYVG